MAYLLTPLTRIAGSSGCDAKSIVKEGDEEVFILEGSGGRASRARAKPRFGFAATL